MSFPEQACDHCGSFAVFSGWLDQDGNACDSTEYRARAATFCLDCGEEQ